MQDQREQRIARLIDTARPLLARLNAEWQRHYGNDNPVAPIVESLEDVQDDFVSRVQARCDTVAYYRERGCKVIAE